MERSGRSPELGGKINRAPRLRCARSGGGAQGDTRRQRSVTWVNERRSTERGTRSARVSQTLRLRGLRSWTQARAPERGGQAVRREAKPGTPRNAPRTRRPALPCPPLPSRLISPAVPSAPLAGGRVRSIPRSGSETNPGLLPPGTAQASRGPRAAEAAVTGRAPGETARALTRDSTARAARITHAQGEEGAALQQVTPRVGF